MAEVNDNKKALSVYKILCDALDERNWKYQKHPEDLVVTFTVTGEDIPMNFVLMIDAKRELVRLVSPLPFTFSEEKRLEGAIATSFANYKLADGSFDYNYKEGKLNFRMTSSFKDSLISKELFQYMIACACYTVDEYNDKFLMINKGMLSIADFCKK